MGCATGGPAGRSVKMPWEPFNGLSSAFFVSKIRGFHCKIKKKLSGCTALLHSQTQPAVNQLAISSSVFIDVRCPTFFHRCLRHNLTNAMSKSSHIAARSRIQPALLVICPILLLRLDQKPVRNANDLGKEKPPNSR